MTQRDSSLGRFSFGAREDENKRRSRGNLKRALVAVTIALLLGAGAAYLWYFERDLASRWLQKADIVSGVTTAYKWRDAAGNWQITDQPPRQGIAYETIRVRSDVNILPALKEEKD